MYKIEDDSYFWILGALAWIVSGSFLTGLLFGLLAYVMTSS